MKLSVLDQSFARTYDDAPQALQETIQMAQLCEELGYHRFWVSEHHAFKALAGSAPEVLLSALGAATKSIRLGSGGIMLPHYSTYKIAEQFSMLANLYPERIDLGIGRAPGADMSTAVALASGRQPRFHAFPEQVQELQTYLYQEQTQPLVSPQPPRSLPIWMLGTSGDSAVLAAQHGLPYCLGAFINPTVHPHFVETYKQQFQASRLWEKPHTMLAIGVFCAETEEQALAQQRTYDVNFYRFITGQMGRGFLPPEQALAVPVDQNMKAFMEQRNTFRAAGTPDQVKEKIQDLALIFEVDEIMAVTNMYYFEDRQNSFRLLKQAFAEAV